MADHGMAISLTQMSHSSEDDSSDQTIPNIVSGGASGGSSSHQIPPSSAAHHHQHHHLSPPPKKPRGRPPGSKNKPKPPVVITQDNEEVLKSVVIEVGPGSDVVEAVVNFARRRQVCISVLSGTGSLANVTLRHPVNQAPAYTLHGPFILLSLTGTYMSGPYAPPPSPPPIAVAAASSSSMNPNYPSAPIWNSFSISLSGAQGQVFGGVVAGKIVAASVVVVTATVFKKPEYYKSGFDGNDGGGGGGDGDNNPSASGGSSDTMSGFNVANPTALTTQLPSADTNMMQWGHIHPSHRPANY